MTQQKMNEGYEPTEQEMQDYVNKVYDYAADLYINQNKSWEQVELALIHEGISSSDAAEIVKNLKEEESKAKHNSANSEIGWGFAWLLGGILLTTLTSGNILFYGAIIWGAWDVLRGLYHKF